MSIIVYYPVNARPYKSNADIGRVTGIAFHSAVFPGIHSIWDNRSKEYLILSKGSGRGKKASHIMSMRHDNRTQPIVRSALLRPLATYPAEVQPNFTSGGAFDNRLIRGDNLTAMQALLPEFQGRIKCVYIDPPYNTGNTFAHYDDDARHDCWLTFMRDRLQLMKELLADDGVLFISIGDEEAAYLKVLADGLFGRQNYCGTLVWEKKKKPSFLDRNMGSVTEYILAYAKNRTLTGPFSYGKTTPGKRYPLNNAGNGIRILRFDADKVQFNCADGYYPPQDMSSGQIITRLLDGLTITHGRNANAFRLEGEWRYSQTTLDDIMAANDPIQISKVPFRPNHIKPGGEPKKLKNLLNGIHYQMSTYEDATEESRALFGTSDAFDYPKPEKLIHLLLNAVTQEGDWVLDAFAGSGTTGAVAHKMNRRWIMIEQGEHCHTHILPRLQKVVTGQDTGGISPLLNWQGGGGFHCAELVEL